MPGSIAVYNFLKVLAVLSSHGSEICYEVTENDSLTRKKKVIWGKYSGCSNTDICSLPKTNCAQSDVWEGAL
jgi:hypothetical protein